MKITKTKTLIAILTAAILLLIPIVAMASDPPALVPKTGQTTSYDTGDDGDHQAGIAIPNPRFTDNTDGTITDNLTGLVWLKDSACFESTGMALFAALTNSNTLNSGECGLTDGSEEGDWRLPSLKELQSLIDYTNSNPALPSGHPFINVGFQYVYWSSTTYTVEPSSAWYVTMSNGEVRNGGKNGNAKVLPVRGPDRDDDGLQDHEDNCPTVSNPDQKDVDSNNIGDVCDPNTVYGTISGDVQEGVSVEISLISCGGTTPVSTTTTNDEGYYAFGGLSNGGYEIEPQNASYVFNPVNRSVLIPQGNICAYNFVAAAKIYTISGTVSGDVLDGVTMTLSGDSSATTTTASDGSYSFTEVVSRSYTITPSKFAYTFDPESSTVEIIDTNVIGIDFTTIYIPCDTVDRFLDNNDGTVTDCRTDLIWLKNANCFNQQNWDTAMSSAARLNSGECGLADGSVEGDWRLPTKEELQEIGTDPPVAWGAGLPPEGWTQPAEPFFGVVLQQYWYWTSSVKVVSPDNFVAYGVGMDDGVRTIADFTNGSGEVWPVRSAN